MPFIVAPIAMWKLCWHSALLNVTIPELPAAEAEADA
jgi:hypothetical protein